MARKKAESASVIGEYEYETTKIRDKSGKVRTSRGNNDAVAKAMLLHKAAEGELDTVIKANKLEERMKPHAKKQEGLRRMMLGVMLRALVRNGTPVKIGKVTVEKLSQKVEMPKVEKIERATKKVAKAPRKRRASKDQAAEAA